MQNNVKLTEIRQSDSSILFEWINDAGLVNFNAGYKPVNFKSHEDWMYKVSESKDTVFFAIRLKVDDSLIGTCQLNLIDRISATAFLQIRIGRSEHQSKGFGVESINELVEFGFKHLNLRKICLYVFEDNHRAIKCYSRCLFEREGVLKKHSYVSGEYKNLVIMSRFRNTTGEEA